MRKKTVGFGRKALSVATSVALVTSMCPIATSTAVASEVSPTESMSAEGYVTCTSSRAAEPAPEILGLSNVSTNSAWGSGIGKLEWNAPYYYIFGTSTYNSSPNPYMVNSVAKAAGDETASPVMVSDSSGQGQGAVGAREQGGPTASLKAYASNEYSKAVWNMLPDVIFGNSKSYNYNGAEYAEAAGKANDKTDYKVYGDDNGGVNYVTTTTYTMINSMYDLADAGNAAASATGKKLRYGDATAIAKQYELYVRGTQGYIMQQLAANSKEKKTVAAVSSYDSSTGKYTIIKSGVTEGTAPTNRYLEAVAPVATNIADDMDDVTTVTKETLAGVDLILVGSQNGSDYSTIIGSFDTDMANKTYYTTGGSVGSCYGVIMNSVENAQNVGRILGCLYSEYVDQSDWVAYYYQNFYHLNTGKLSEAIANAMDGVRNWNNTGTEATAWDEADVADYNESTVLSKLAIGASYLLQNKDSVVSYMKLTDNIDASYVESSVASAVDTSKLDKTQYTDAQWTEITAASEAAKTAAKSGDSAKLQAAIEAYQATLSKDKAHDVSVLFATNPCGNQYYTGSAITPYDGKYKIYYPTKSDTFRLTQGKDYEVTYANNTEIGTATATITGKGEYSGTYVTTFDITDYTLTVKSGENTVVTLPMSQLAEWAAQSTDNKDVVEYQYGTTVVYVPASQYITANTLMANIGVTEWDSVTFSASDGFDYTLTKDVNDNGKWYPAQSTDAYPTDGAKNVPAILALSYGTQDISTTAFEAGTAAKDKVYGSWPRLFMGALEADYTSGNIAGKRFVTDVCNVAFAETVPFKSDEFADELVDENGNTYWYSESAATAIDMGLIEGNDNPDGTKTFDANMTLTRAQVVTMLWRYYAPNEAKAYDETTMAKTRNETGMPDVASSYWYTAAANWAVANKVINGTEDGRFDPAGSITRDQFCAIVANAAAKFAGAKVEGADRTKFNSMPDNGQVEAWAVDSVAWCLNNGVISGKDDKYIAPLDIVTRAESAAILVNSIQGGLLYQPKTDE